MSNTGVEFGLAWVLNCCFGFIFYTQS